MRYSLRFALWSTVVLVIIYFFLSFDSIEVLISPTNETLKLIILSFSFLLSLILFVVFEKVQHLGQNPLVIILMFFTLKIFIYLIFTVVVLFTWPSHRNFGVVVLLSSYLSLTVLETWMKWRIIGH
jgi:hypothetical protein